MTTEPTSPLARAAEALRAKLEDAWREGYRAGVRDEARDLEGTSGATPNPYPKEQA